MKKSLFLVAIVIGFGVSFVVWPNGFIFRPAYGALYMSSVKSKDSLAINELLLSSGLPNQEISEVEWQLGHLIDSNLIRGIRCLDKNNTLSGIKEIQLLVITPAGIIYCESVGRRELEVLYSSGNAKIKEISEFLLGRINES